MSRRPLSNQSALVLAFLLFFSWGFVTVLNDILIPHLKAMFELSAAEAMLVQFCFFGAYFTLAWPAGRLVGRLGYQVGIVTGLGVSAVGALMFLPAAFNGSYAQFLLALFVLASGITVLQVAANPFAALLGPERTAASRLNFAQGFNSLGTTIAPALGAMWILSDDQPRADAVVAPYLTIAAILVLLAFVFWRCRLPTLQSHAPSERVEAPLVLTPTLRRGALAIFLYVGAEVGIGSLLVLFFGLEEIAGMSHQQAGYLVSFYWGGAMVGRFLGAAVQRHFAPARVLAGSAVGAIGLIALTVTVQGSVAVWTLLAVGLCNSIMFATIFSISIEGMGAATSRASGVLVMAIVGGAVVPVLMGALADAFGYPAAIGSATLCYLYIVYFAVMSMRTTSLHSRTPASKVSAS